MKKSILLLGVIALVSCKKKADESWENYTDSAVAYVDSATIEVEDKVYENMNNIIEEETYTPPVQAQRMKYSFIVFYYKSSLLNKEGVKVTSIMETLVYMSEDEEYRMMNEAQNEAFRYRSDERIMRRELKSYDSYAEASKERERILGIN